MNEDRVHILLENIIKLSSGEFDISFPITDEQDEIAAIGLGLDMLADELKSITVSKKQYFENQKRYEALLESIAEGVVEVEDSNTITYFNENALNILSMTPIQLRGTDIGEVFFLNEGTTPLRLNSLADGKHRLKVTYRPPQGEDRFFSLNVNVSKHQKNHLMSFFDITESYKMEIAQRYKMLNSQETERQRIAYELHDGIGQILNAISIKMEMLELGLNTNMDPQMLIKQMRQTKGLLTNSIREIRTITKSLYPVSVFFGIDKAIQQLIADLKNLVSNLEFSFQSNLGPLRFNQEFELSVFRILQESINNGIKHSQTQKIAIVIELDHSTQNLTLKYQDMGIGFDPNEVSKNIGFRSITDRVDAFHGQVHFFSAPGEGTRVVTTFDTAGLELPANK